MGAGGLFSFFGASPHACAAVFPPQTNQNIFRRKSTMDFFGEAINTLSILVVALGAGLAVWGVVNLLEGYGNDNPGAKSQGIKQLMAGGGIVLIGLNLVPLLSGLFG
jgi:hypothetical protein